MAKGTYVARRIKNKNELHEWFKNQGVDMMPIDELHSTISYSKKEFKPKINNNEILVSQKDLIEIAPLGNDGAIVLKYNSKEMQDRFNDCISRGAIFDYDNYTPHITLTYNGKDLKLENLKMPNFDIVLNDEYKEELDLNWKDKVVKDSYTYDRGFSKFETKIDDSTGFLEVNGTIARTGVQDYYGLELGQEFIDKYNLEPMKKYGVYRPREEVLKQESLDTYINKPITDNHPKEFVTVDNIKDLGKGSTSTISTYEKDGIDYIKGRLTIKDKATINKALSGKVELSPGYTQTLVAEDGEFQGRKYQFKQTDIKINHVALVDRGRCEGQCKITADNYNIIEDENNKKGKSMPQILIDGVSHEVTDCVAKYIGGLNSKITSLDADIKKKEEDMKEQKQDMEKMKGENEKLKEDMEEEKKKTSDSTIDALVSEKVALIDTAKTLKVEVKAEDSIMDMKKAIISSNSKISLDGKSDEFIDGVYETVIASTVGKQKAIQDSQSSAFDGFEPKKETTTNDAYNKYVDNLLNAHKGDK